MELILETGLAYYCDYAIGWTMYDSNHIRGKRFSLLQHIQTSSGRPYTPLRSRCCWLHPRVKVSYGGDNSPSFSVKVKNE
jgi:hypothetical protein